MGIDDSRLCVDTMLGDTMVTVKVKYSSQDEWTRYGFDTDEELETLCTTLKMCFPEVVIERDIK